MGAPMTLSVVFILQVVDNNRSEIVCLNMTFDLILFWAELASDWEVWLQMGQICYFISSVSVHFSCQIVSDWAEIGQFGVF